MSGWRFLLASRWAGYVGLTIAFAVACFALGNWQLARQAEAHAAVVKLDANYDSAPLPLTTLLPALDSFDEAKEWSPARLRGTYLSDEQLLVRTRPLGGRPGFEVLVPLLLEDGTIFIVDRGWVPTGSTHDSPDVVPEAPTGTVEVIARLKPGEPRIPGRTAPEGQIATIELHDIADLLDAPTYTGAYGLMVDESPAAAENPTPLLRPARDEGPHLSYAFQWFVFALLGFTGLAWAIRQEYRLANADDPDEQKRAAERERKRARRAPTDGEIEDAILDRPRAPQASDTSSA